MDAVATIGAIGLAAYAATGLVTGLAFVSVGIARVQAAPVTIGARLLLLPAAAALWPLVLARWLRAGRKP
jgi:hypothetical protein